MTVRPAADTSVVIPAVVDSHEAHTIARSILAESPMIPAHVALEAYSVLTRLPVQMRVRGAVAADVIARTFPEVIPLNAEEQQAAVRTLAAAGIVGGSVYDGIVGLTVRAVGADLYTRDVRARLTYEALGVRVRWLDGGPYGPPSVG